MQQIDIPLYQTSFYFTITFNFNFLTVNDYKFVA